MLSLLTSYEFQEHNTNQAYHKSGIVSLSTTEHPATEIATPEPALSGGEILPLRLRMTRSEGARNDTRYHSLE